MAVFFGDVNTRARGLGTRLLDTSTLDRLANAPSLFALHEQMGALGFSKPDAMPTTASLEHAVRRHAADQMAVLERWSDGRRRLALGVLFEEEDHRSTQAMLRGAEQGAPAEARLSGLMPTRSLPERALRALAAQPTVKDVVRLLALWKHPLAPALIKTAKQPNPSLLQLELELHRGFAGQARKNARKGDAHLRAHVAMTVDIMNAWTLLLHDREDDPEFMSQAYIEGGATLVHGRFSELLRLDGREPLQQRLASEFAHTPLGEAFATVGDDLPSLAPALLRAQIVWHQITRLRNPASTAAVLEFAGRLRAQGLSLGRIVWGIALDAPPSLIKEASAP